MLIEDAAVVSLPLWGLGSKVGVWLSIQRARLLRKSMPASEARLWNALRLLKPLGHHFRRQVPLGRYYADFCIHKHRLVIEVDGDTHYTDARIAYDISRDQFIRTQGYRILRITNHDIHTNLDGVVEAILLALQEPPPLIPPHKGEGDD
jgi:very-short-patch-repair endonuclease